MLLAAFDGAGAQQGCIVVACTGNASSSTSGAYSLVAQASMDPSTCKGLRMRCGKCLPAQQQNLTCSICRGQHKLAAAMLWWCTKLGAAIAVWVKQDCTQHQARIKRP